ncbi:class I SAM-dependent methyltransferase [Leptolyngbya iicbica]|uniref:Class I SAM-dependent methyltransferase n=2 Tax=Cyanophyceae TaxID=3028117 RepID=A0A4Q7EFQ3_9CYAN|nr:class I SAM-dependent methyltransferase [Leptolyngbya sp. LK]RZM82411.1 class I SAM-dependent methyltransferase [Leptolyngbya sp. LK]
MTFKDYFSGHATDYAQYRPHYPAELFAWLAQQCGQRDRVWDCATGNGQAAIALAEHFTQVIATDGSAAQLQQAPVHPQVTYRVAVAEASGIAARSLDLVTVAQAVHWFQLEAFYAELRRVLKPDGLLAIWCYGCPHLANPALASLLQTYYGETLDDFWTPERRLVETGYAALDFPWVELTAPAYSMQVMWTLAELLGYLFTWSATQRFIAAHGVNPLEDLAEHMTPHWPSDRVLMTWPITMRVGRFVE